MSGCENRSIREDSATLSTKTIKVVVQVKKVEVQVRTENWAFVLLTGIQICYHVRVIHVYLF